MTPLSERIDCDKLTSDDVNLKLHALISTRYKKILLSNIKGKKDLISGLKGNTKIEIVGDTANGFASNIKGLNVVANGNVGKDSAHNIEGTKFVIFGSCLENFGNNIKSSELYVLENCTKNSFSALKDKSKVVIGGQPSSEFANNMDGGIVVILNLKGGSIFIDEDWFNGYKAGNVYIRGEKNKIKVPSDRFSLEETSDFDLDFYLPLISEFARLFSVSLSDIKSTPFYKLVVKV